VFEGLSLNIDEGKCLIIKGDNGSGKTTLFRILNGLSFPSEGSYTFDGTEITRDYLKNNVNAKRFHKRIGYLFQNPDIMLFNGKVYDEIAFGPRQMGLSDVEVDKRTCDCMELFGITDLAGKAPYHLSGGQKKKVALAAVMALNPDVIILDEPFAGLDKKTQDFLVRFLGELKSSGKTLIIATHDEGLVPSLGDSVLDMNG
jgi:cobalt/nickel transport system ATP-binding protein